MDTFQLTKGFINWSLLVLRALSSVLDILNKVDFRGGTHMLRHTGMCHNFVLFCFVFFKKSLNMGPIFQEKIPNYGSDFQNFPG